MSLDRNAILSANDSKVEAVDIPQWGGAVHIRVMTGAERDAIEAEFTANKGKPAPNLRGRFAAMILCDEHGQRLFTDKDAVALGAKSASALSLIFDAGMKLSGITSSEAASLLGESVAAPSGDSGSASP